MTIGGVATTTSSTFDVLNPVDETLVGACPQGTSAHVDAAVVAARRAFAAWSALPDAHRAAKLLEMADIIEAHQTSLSTLITREQGKTQSGPGANFEIGGAIAWTRATAALQMNPETIQDDAQGLIEVHRKPVGVVASITPWNWPLLIAVWHIMPALRAGCTVIIKPSPFTPLSTLRLVELLNGILPPGVLSAVAGGTDVGAHLTQHPSIDKVVFTGSIETGRKVMVSAAATLKRLTLELGGNDAGIVLPNTKVDALLEKLFWGCFLNAGQTCAALKRLYVHEDQYDEVVDKFAAYVQRIPVGDGMFPENLIGPVSNKMQFDKVVALVESARRQGARIVTGGVSPPPPGYFYPLTLIADATDDMRVVREEQFGPVLPILRYRSIDEAVERANSLNVGLGGSVWSDDARAAAKVAAKLECGTAWVNQHGVLHPFAPFGGVKCSGIGVEFGVDGLREYTTIQVINVALQS
jgi:acyl-CoA reductase-like NAD-dependent aldehyde dehydrogenase